MNLLYHRSVQGDVSAVLNYYDEVGGPALGDAFFEEFMVYVALALEHPTRFHPIEGDLRRANLDRFPITSSTAFRMIRSASWLSGITSAIRDTGSSADKIRRGAACPP